MMLRILQKDLTRGSKKLYISSNFYIKGEFHFCVLKFRKGCESSQCQSLQQPLVVF